MLLSLRVQIEFLSIFSFFWPPRKTKQGTEALRGWFHRLTQVEDHFREGFLKMAAFFFSFFLWLSMRIFFFQFFFFGWWWWLKGRGNIFLWIPWYSFSVFLHLVCLSQTHCFVSDQIPWELWKATCAWVCLRDGAWWEVLCEVKGIWQEPQWVHTHSLQGADMEASSGKTLHLWMPQPPVDKAVLVSTFWA